MKKELLRFFISLIFLSSPMLSRASTIFQMDTSIHRSLQPESIQLTLLDGLNSGCLFIGDTLQFNLSRENGKIVKL